ncbi:MAG: HDOD domain-containing protein [Desulfobacteraceae bacterium]
MSLKNKVLKLIQKKDSDLPTLPAVADKIVSAASDKKTTTEELSEIISYDQAITFKLIKLANSIYYAQRTKVDTIKRAVTVIGYDEIIGIALSMSVLSSLSDRSGFSLDMKALWMHAIGCATAAKELAKRTNPSIANKVFVPCLLHDVGKIIFSVYFREEYRKVRQVAMETRTPLHSAEIKVFEVDHAVVAALLLKRWNFPNSIIIPCRYHHKPDACPPEFKHMTLIINLSNYLVQKAGIGHSGNPVPVACKNIINKVGTNEQILHLTIENLKKNEAKIKDFFQLTTGE